MTSKKHLIIHGDIESGKSIFLNMLLEPRKQFVEFVDGRPRDLLKGNFLWTLGDFRPKILRFQDVNVNIHPEEFLPLTEKIKVNAQNQEIFFIEPMLIIEYPEELKIIPSESWFTRRFDVFNTNTATYKELINYLKAFNHAKIK